MSHQGPAVASAAVDAVDGLVQATVGSLLANAVRRWPDRVALQWLGEDGLLSLTWQQVWDRATMGAEALRSAPDHPAPVAVYAPNSVGWYVSMWAIALSGRTLVPVNPALTARELAGQLADSGARTVVAAAEYRGRKLLDVVEELHLPGVCVHDVEHWISTAPEAGELPAADPGACFLIQYTSGTTGTPKGAVLSHRTCVNLAATMTPVWCPGDHEILCSALPMHHISALAAHALAMAWIGGTYVMLGEFTPSSFVGAARASRATYIAGVPTMYLRVLDDPELCGVTPPDVRVVMVGGASIPPDLVARIEKHFRARASVMYGQSEAPAITATSLDDPAWVKADTVGRVLPMRELCIVDTATATILPIGQVGEIWVRTPIKMDQYLHRPEATVQTIDEDGWLHTGDLGAIDADGLLYFHGRLREIIVRGGENVYPREVEAAIESHPGVSQVAVVGLPDTEWGEIVAAAIVPQPGARLEPEELSAWVTARLARFKQPSRWHFIDEFPMTASGKPQKFKIVEMLTGDGR